MLPDDVIDRPGGRTPEHRGRAWHQAFLYETPDQYADGVTAFVGEALERQRPAFVAVPTTRMDLVRDRFGHLADEVSFADMTVLGRNPSRIIPAIESFIAEHDGRPVSVVGEPMWPGRTPDEVAEATRNEALLNRAFDVNSAEILCPYDEAALPPEVVAEAHRTHPELLRGDGRFTSDHYADPASIWAQGIVLPPVPGDAESVSIAAESLARIRRLVRSLAKETHLDGDRADDIVLAVSELAGNSIRHGGGIGMLSAWREDRSMIVQVVDGGRITDPFAGRRLPALEQENGRGLWLVNQLCDLVQLQSTDTGTTVRFRVDA